MKHHRGGKYYPDYGYIDGSVPGEGMTADQIVAAISEKGITFSSAVPLVLPVKVSATTFDTASGGLRGPFALGATETLSFRPRDDKGFGLAQDSDESPRTMFTINLMIVNTGTGKPSVYPPYLEITATPGGCVDGVAPDGFVWVTGQADDPDSVLADPHQHFTLTFVADCSCSDGDYFTYDIKVETLIPFTSEADYKWWMMPNGIMVVR